MSRKPAQPARPPPPTDVWLKARTSVDKPYPCWCRRNKRCTTSGPAALWCPCWQRTDIGTHLPAHCCARTGTEQHPK